MGKIDKCQCYITCHSRKTICYNDITKCFVWYIYMDEFHFKMFSSYVFNNIWNGSMYIMYETFLLHQRKSCFLCQMPYTVSLSQPLNKRQGKNEKGKSFDWNDVYIFRGLPFSHFSILQMEKKLKSMMFACISSTLSPSNNFLFISFVISILTFYGSIKTNIFFITRLQYSSWMNEFQHFNSNVVIESTESSLRTQALFFLSIQRWVIARKIRK